MNIADFHFIRPYWLLALLPWLVILVLTARHKLQQGNWTKVCDEALLPYILQQKAGNRSRVSLTAGALASLLTIVALAGPTWNRLPSPVFRNESALVIALDLSRSMNAADIKPSRLVRARYKIADILKQRKDGQTALLVYAGEAFTVTPLTDDTETIASQLSALTTAIMPSQGSNTAAALEQAKDLLEQAGLQKGQILLVTDGVDFDKTESAVESLGHYQLSILGVGTRAGAPIRAPEGGFVKDRQGNIVIPKLDAAGLAKLAKLGHGIYETISANDRDIATLASHFGSRIQDKGSEKSDLLLQQWAEKGPWLLLLVLPLAAMSFRKGLLTIALLVFLPFPKTGYALDWQDVWLTQDQQGQKDYQAQQFDQAAARFRNPEWKAAAQYKAGHYDQALETLKGVNTADSFYNQGNALAQSGQLAEALKAYDKALEINPNHDDAKYNKEIVTKELEKQQKNQQNQQQQQGKDQQQSGQNSEQEQPGDTSGESGESKPPKETEDAAQQASDQNSESETDQPEEPQSSEKPKDSEKDAQQAEAQQQGQTEDQEKQAAQAVQSDVDQPQDETQQANEQWLKRIPDDPAGLLRRKFLYQYGQRGRQSESREDW